MSRKHGLEALWNEPHAQEEPALADLSQMISPRIKKPILSMMLLMCVELILAAVNTNFIAFSYYSSDVAGQIFVFFILTVAAAEVAMVPTFKKSRRSSPFSISFDIIEFSDPLIVKWIYTIFCV